MWLAAKRQHACEDAGWRGGAGAQRGVMFGCCCRYIAVEGRGKNEKGFWCTTVDAAGQSYLYWSVTDEWGVGACEQRWRGVGLGLCGVRAAGGRWTMRDLWSALALGGCVSRVVGLVGRVRVGRRGAGSLADGKRVR